MDRRDKRHSCVIDYSMKLHQLFDTRCDVKNDDRHVIDLSEVGPPDAISGIVFWCHVVCQKADAIYYGKL